MYRPRIRRAAMTAAALAASLGALTTPAPIAGATATPLAASPAPAASSALASGPVLAASPAPAASGAGGAPPLLLINGARVLGGRGGPHVVARASGVPAAVISFFSCGQRSAVPAEALPYLGHGLDPSLFSLTALRRAERNGRLPVRVAYRGARPALPGITITRPGHGLADGYLTASSARQFGAALRRQFSADHARGSYGADGLFAGGVSVTLPGIAAPPRPRANFPEHIVTVKGTNQAGQPDTGDLVTVFDVGHCFRLAAENIFFHGVTKFAAPSGHDWAVGEFFSGTGTHVALRLVVLPQFTVDGNKTVRVDARSATSKITFSTPRPATTNERSLTLVRSSQNTQVGMGWDVTGDSSLWVSPVRHAPSFGTLQAFTSGELDSPAGPGIPYSYLLNFPARPGVIPAQQHFVARPPDLAMVRETYFQDAPTTGSWMTSGGMPAQLAEGPFGLFLPVRMPGHQIQYLSARPRMQWQTEEFGPDFAGGQAGPVQSYRAGQQVSTEWNRYPLHPGPNVVAPGSADALPVLPSASRAGNTLTLDITPFSGSEPGHVASPLSGFASPASGRYAIFQNGRKIASGDAAKAAGGFADLLLTATLSPQASVIKFTLTASRAAKQFPLSAASSDAWTWRSRPAAAATVPAPWSCGVTASRAPARSRHCAVQGMLTARYHVTGLSLAGATSPGRQQISLDITRLQLAAPSRLAGAQLQVSFDHGKTWHAATVTARSDRGFRVAFSAPPKALVSLRVHAADAAGDTITETILDAYRTSAATG